MENKEKVTPEKVYKCYCAQCECNITCQGWQWCPSPTIVSLFKQCVSK